MSPDQQVSRQCVPSVLNLTAMLQSGLPCGRQEQGEEPKLLSAAGSWSHALPEQTD